MDENEIRHFVLEGRNRLTTLNHAIRQLADWSDAFSQRGGMVELGNDAALIALINTKVQGAISGEDRATVARLRTDV